MSSLLLPLLLLLEHSCPFPSDGPWNLGATVRDAVYSASASLTGATGPLTMLPGEGEADGEEADGRDAEITTFCAVNLRPHGTLGGRFELISTLDGGEIGTTGSEGYQVGDMLVVVCVCVFVCVRA